MDIPQLPNLSYMHCDCRLTSSSCLFEGGDGRDLTRSKYNCLRYLRRIEKLEAEAERRKDYKYTKDLKGRTVFKEMEERSESGGGGLGRKKDKPAVPSLAISLFAIFARNGSLVASFNWPSR